MDNHNNDRQPDRLVQDLVLEIVLLPQSRQETMEKPFFGTRWTLFRVPFLLDKH